MDSATAAYAGIPRSSSPSSSGGKRARATHPTAPTRSAPSPSSSSPTDPPTAAAGKGVRCAWTTSPAGRRCGSSPAATTPSTAAASIPGCSVPAAAPYAGTAPCTSASPPSFRPPPIISRSKAGHYQNPEEIPFSLNLPWPLVPPYSFPQVLYPAAASVNVSQTIWDMYFNNLLNLFLAEGVDGNYASTVASDLVCLQALSRRIHYGRYVSEAKFTNAPQNYTAAIRAQDRNALMNMLTSTSQEDTVVSRVTKKAMVFGQNVTLDTNSSTTYKVDPSVVARLYRDWIIPITKVVEVEYLIRRLD